MQKIKNEQAEQSQIKQMHHLAQRAIKASYKRIEVKKQPFKLL
jgi:hypothetical protein